MVPGDKSQLRKRGKGIAAHRGVYRNKELFPRTDARLFGLEENYGLLRSMHCCRYIVMHDVSLLFNAAALAPLEGELSQSQTVTEGFCLWY